VPASAADATPAVPSPVLRRVSFVPPRPRPARRAAAGWRAAVGRRALRAAGLALVLVAGAAAAEPTPDPAAEALLEDVANAAAAVEDVSLRLTGRLVDAAGGELALEVELLAIPDARALSAYVLQPDAVADNMLVLDGDTLASYAFLTHQVTLFDAADPDALGGTLPDLDVASLDPTLDPRAWFEGFVATDVTTSATDAGPAQVVTLRPEAEGLQVGRVTLLVPDATTLPRGLRVFGPDGALVADLAFEDLATNVGLTRDEVTYLPEGAEVIDERTPPDGG